MKKGTFKMSICKGIAGNRGRNPKGIFIHNDAGSGYADAAHYRNWLPTHNLENGFAHYYVCSDGTVQAEDDKYGTWHCADYDGNMNYLSIEVCQSMGNLEVFKKNEETALRLAAQKCKQYGIIPNAGTIRLHQEVAATACPHRSVEIHHGASNTKAYFISRIKQFMGENVSVPVHNTSGNTVFHAASMVSKGNPGIIFTYAVQLTDGTILPPVNNLEDFAGITGRSIANAAIKVNKGSVKYQVHILGGGWLPWVTGYDWKNHNNGYAGNGKAIDAVRVYYDTPADIVSKYGYQRAQYRVSPVNSGYYPWQFDDETGNGQDGFAGCFGAAIDRFQLF